jgi:hypothetical protein
VQQYPPGKKNGPTALRLATDFREDYTEDSRRDSINTLKELLNVEGIVFLERLKDPTFELAIDEGSSEAVEEFLDRPKLVETFVTSHNLLLAFDKLAGMEEDKALEHERARRAQIARALIAKAKKPDVLNREVVEKIITSELKEIWDATPKDILAEDLKNSLLHLAVWHQKFKFVKQFLVEDSDSVKKTYKLGEATEPKYPLWYNNHPKEVATGEATYSNVTKTLIRSEIVNKMIHEVTQIEILTDIFYDSDGKSSSSVLQTFRTVN